MQWSIQTFVVARAIRGHHHAGQFQTAQFSHYIDESDNKRILLLSDAKMSMTVSRDNLLASFFSIATYENTEV